MKITLKKEHEKYFIFEDDRKIYYFEETKEQGLISVFLKNMYDEEVRGMYQIQRRNFDFFNKKSKGYTFYDQDEKLGELHYIKDGFDIKYHDIYYRFFGGKHANKDTVICLDRDVQIAEFVLGEHASVSFRNSNLNAEFAILLYLFNFLLPFKQFDEKAYLFTYKGRYNDQYDFEK